MLDAYVWCVNTLLRQCFGALNKTVYFEFGMHQTEFLAVVRAVCFKMVIMQ
jgi:hypothetical protein